MRPSSPTLRFALAALALLCLSSLGCSPGPVSWKVGGGTILIRASP